MAAKAGEFKMRYEYTSSQERETGGILIFVVMRSYVYRWYIGALDLGNGGGKGYQLGKATWYLASKSDRFCELNELIRKDNEKRERY